MRHFFLFLALSYSLLSYSQNKSKDASFVSSNAQTITFYAKDSVLITADTYFLKDIPPTVLLCHQAGFSRGEYIETAKKLND
ncbi:MAG: hypothetical protein KDC74_02130, partial [Flavobacteriaceae bacterium]|nr:hypothetical protein [Flavobacteriaceae bacterium]